MLILRILLILALVSPAVSQDTPDPIDIQKQEEVEVELVLIDALVLDRQGRTVPGLTAADFEVIVDQEIRPINTLDESCESGASDDPRGVRNPAERPRIEAPSAGRKIVLAFDYLHLDPFSLEDALRSAQDMLENRSVAGEEVMVVALNGGIRIEQSFTEDTGLITDALQRMQNDISLWGGRYDHITEEPFFRGLQLLVDVLGIIDGSKALVLYSNNPSSSDEGDPAFMELAASAAGSRCSVYPVHSVGLQATPPPGGG